MVRLAGLGALLSAAWCVAGLVFLAVRGVPDSESPAWHSLLVAGGVLLGTVGLLVCAAIVGFMDHRAKERRWLADRHHGTATMTYLLPGDVNADHGTQDLRCHLKVMADGMPTISGEYKAAVGPLDALKVVEGARFPCEASPSVPEHVFVSITAGRVLEFKRR